MLGAVASSKGRGKCKAERRFGTRCEGPEEVGADLVDSAEPAVFFHEEE